MYSFLMKLATNLWCFRRISVHQMLTESALHQQISIFNNNLKKHILDFGGKALDGLSTSYVHILLESEAKYFDF